MTYPPGGILCKYLQPLLTVGQEKTHLCRPADPKLKST